jgi:anti-sigma B factor antagonist
VAQILRIRASLGHFHFQPGTLAMMLETEVFEIDPDITVVSCAGRFTLGTQLRLTESMINTLIQKGVRKLVIDLTHTEIVDSAGLGVLMHVFGEMEQLGGTMRVAGANERVANLFHVTHTNGILALDPDLMTSVKNIKG